MIRFRMITTASVSAAGAERHTMMMARAQKYRSTRGERITLRGAGMSGSYAMPAGRLLRRAGGRFNR